jgi:hypothetical protein
MLFITLSSKVSLLTLKLYQHQATIKANRRIPVPKEHTYVEIRVRNGAQLYASTDSKCWQHGTSHGGPRCVITAPVRRVLHVRATSDMLKKSVTADRSSPLL